MHIRAPGGEVILPDAHAQMSYERGGYAAVRRAGDFLFLSGTIVYRRPEENTDVAAFKDQVRRTFRQIGQSLAAAGASFDDVVMINSFHVWNGPDFTGSRDDQFKAFEQVKEEFMHGPHPAWTAVGAAGLLGQGGIVEVQMMAYAPVHRRR
jgi:enamine deaminase RidA (YjgF/YER057c/UK114 family)